MAEFYRRKKICQMCAGKSVDYKDVAIVSKYINEKGKILPRRMTGACAKHQRHINLSTNIYNDDSIASVAVAAHECGHAIQDKESYSMLRFRTYLVPIVNFTSRFATIFLIIGIATQITGLLTFGIFLLSGGLLFQLVTLPVEFNASARARVQLQELGLVDKKDLDGTDKVLHAAALTYVASFLSTALQILRLVLVNRNRR